MLRVELVDTEDRFCSLEEEWRDLISRCPDATYFLTWEYVSASWKYFAADRKLWILTARDDKDTLVGIAPFAIAPDRVGPFSFRRLEFMCRVEIPFEYVNYYLDGENVDIIATPEYRDDVVAKFLEYLDTHGRDWDVVDLGWLSPRSSIHAHVKDAHRLVLRKTSPSATTTLPDDYVTFERSVMGKSESKQVRKDARRLERDYPGEVEYVEITERDQIGPALLDLDQMKSRWWDDKGEVVPDENDVHVKLHQTFEREFAEAAFDSGWLRFYKLRVGDDVIAADCNVSLHGTHYSLKTGFDPDWKAYSPGNVIQAYENQQLISNGVRRHDLQHGTIESKRKWSNEEREDVRITAVTSWRGVPFFVRSVVGSVIDTHGRRLAQRLLPQRALAWLRQAVRNRTQRMQKSPYG